MPPHPKGCSLTPLPPAPAMALSLGLTFPVSSVFLLPLPSPSAPWSHHAATSWSLGHLSLHHPGPLVCGLCQGRNQTTLESHRGL